MGGDHLLRNEEPKSRAGSAGIGAQGRVKLLFDQFDCDRAASSDVWQLVNPDEPPSPSASPSPSGRPPPQPQCSNGEDDDGDGLTDFPADPGCTDALDDDESGPVSP